MVNKGKKGKNGLRQIKKNDLPVFDSDHDFLRAFAQKEKINSEFQENNQNQSPQFPVNKHGIAVVDAFLNDPKEIEDTEDFPQLLAESFKKKPPIPVKKKVPMSVTKRLKRYPPVEAELDLHGYNTIGAQLRTRSFISTCRHQGVFTISIIVGKGLHSDTGPVLPDVVEDVVKEMKKQDQVLSYAWDRKKKSKSGVLIVYLKQFE